jgi:hypothetical protein
MGFAGVVVETFWHFPVSRMNWSFDVAGFQPNSAGC